LTYGLSIPDVLRCATNQAPDEHSVGGDAWPLQTHDSAAMTHVAAAEGSASEKPIDAVYRQSMVMWRILVGAVALASLVACKPSAVKPGPVPAASSPRGVTSSAVYSSPVPTSSDDQVAYEWCGSMTVLAKLPGGATATFRPAEADRLMIRVRQTFVLTATSRCGMAFQADGEHVDYALGSSAPIPFAGAPGLPSGVVLPSPTTQNPPETVNDTFTALALGISQVAVEVDVPSQQGGYLEPVTITVDVIS
jgi:hypothetical protein